MSRERSRSERLDLVLRCGAQYGLTRRLAARRVSKGTWHDPQKRKEYVRQYASLRKPLRATGWSVNRKVVQKLQTAWDLPLLHTIRRSRHVKAENGSRLWDQRDMTGVVTVVESARHDDNNIRRHASLLDNTAPAVFLKEIGFDPATA